MSKGVGFTMELIDPAKIRQIAPFVTLEGVLMGAWTPDDGHVDPAGVCNALAKAARGLGASIVRRNRVRDIKPTQSGEWRVITEKGEITCEHVVNAGGCYAREIGKWVGIETPIVNMEHHYVVTDSVPEFQNRDEEIPVFRDPRASAYYRQEQKSGLIGIYEPPRPGSLGGHAGATPSGVARTSSSRPTSTESANAWKSSSSGCRCWLSSAFAAWSMEPFRILRTIIRCWVRPVV